MATQSKQKKQKKVSPHVTLIGWFLLILFTYLATRSKTGYVIVYYVLILVLVGLLLLNYQQFVDLIWVN